MIAARIASEYEGLEDLTGWQRSQDRKNGSLQALQLGRMGDERFGKREQSDDR